MATRRNYRDENDYDFPYQRGNGPAWVVGLAMVVATVAFVLWLLPDILHAPGLPEQAKKGAVGNQAPPAAVRRGAVITSIQPAADPVQAQIDKYNAEQEAQAQRVEQPAAQPLPLNSAGEPVISQEQADQQRLSLQLAEQEGNAAADQALAAQRAAANADAANRAPDVSYQEAVDLLHRDPCHVPRANPATCSQGLYKPTPVN